MPIFTQTSPQALEILNRFVNLKNNLVAKNVLHEYFKERMHDKYLYDNDANESKYEEDDMARDQIRVAFLKRKDESKI